MPIVDAVVETPVHRTFRVEQIAGMFDVPLPKRASETFRAEVPDLSEDWSIGVIVGPSGSGKSTIARRAFGKHLYNARAWPEDRAVVDGFESDSTRQITGMLTRVGFSSPPSWVKPYRVLSRGEQFRCELARALLQRKLLVVFDEFTSVVDRTVAQIGSAAVSKAIRGDAAKPRFVAVTCHYDVLPWLEPDWVLDMASGKLDRRRLRRPRIELGLYHCRNSLWPLFARHHYLSGSLSPVAQCFAAYWKKRLVAFCGVLSLVGRKNRWRISRLVTLPDFQGLGIGMAVAEAVAEIYRSRGHRINITAGHPAVIAHCRRAPAWRTVGIRRANRRGTRLRSNYRDSSGRAVVSFEYVGVEAIAMAARRKSRTTCLSNDRPRTERRRRDAPATARI